MHGATKPFVWIAIGLITLVVLGGVGCGGDDEVVHGPPTIARVEPPCISTSGGTVALGGYGFGTTSGVTVTDAVVDGWVSSDTLLTVEISSVTSAGDKTVSVTNVYGSASFEFLSVAQAPEVTSVDPVEGSQCGGDLVTIAGRYLRGGRATVSPDDAMFFSDFEIFEDDPSPGVDRIVGITAPHDPGPATVTLTVNVECGAQTTFEFNYLQEDCPDDIVALTTVEGGSQVVGIGDFNGDGNNDVVVAFHDLPRVTVFHGDGTGEFPEQYDVALDGGDRATALVVADLNGDDRDDIAVAVDGNQRVDVLLQNLGGKVELQSDRYDVDGAPVGIVATHMNVDAYVDLVVVTTAGDVVYLAGTSSGVFSLTDLPPTRLTSPTEGIAAGGPNEEGVSDLYFPLPLLESVATLFNESTVDTFIVTQIDRNIGKQARAIACHDVHPDHDGGEVIVTDKNATSNALTLLGEYSDGTPGYVESFDVGPYAVMAAGGRFRPGGAAGQVALFFGELTHLFLGIYPTPPNFGKMYGELLSGYPTSYASGDLDGDGYDDIVIGLASGTRIDLYLSSVSW